MTQFAYCLEREFGFDGGHSHAFHRVHGKHGFIGRDYGYLGFSIVVQGFEGLV